MDFSSSKSLKVFEFSGQGLVDVSGIRFDNIVSLIFIDLILGFSPGPNQVGTSARTKQLLILS